MYRVARIIAEGMKVDLKEILNEKELKDGRTARTYVSQILEIKDDENMKLAMPMVQGRLIPLAKGEKFEAFFYTAKGLYTTRILILERYKTGNIYSLDIEILAELKKVQRRQYFRLEKSIPVMYTQITEQERDSILKGDLRVEDVVMNSIYSEGVSLDVSGGGMRLVGDLKIDKATPLILNFNIAMDSGVKNFKLLANTIKSEQLGMRRDKFEERVEFLNITPEDREVLIRYIFEEQRKSRRNTM